jgi:hypothetical protein
MVFLLGCEVVMSTFISDRHGSISKHTKAKLANVKHYFDLWHLKKSKWCTKIMNRRCTNMMGADQMNSISNYTLFFRDNKSNDTKEGGCEGVTEWINH